MQGPVVIHESDITPDWQISYLNLLLTKYAMHFRKQENLFKKKACLTGIPIRKSFLMEMQIWE